MLPSFHLRRKYLISKLRSWVLNLMDLHSSCFVGSLTLFWLPRSLDLTFAMRFSIALSLSLALLSVPAQALAPRQGFNRNGGGRNFGGFRGGNGRGGNNNGGNNNGGAAAGGANNGGAATGGNNGANNGGAATGGNGANNGGNNAGNNGGANTGNNGGANNGDPQQSLSMFISAHLASNYSSSP